MYIFLCLIFGVMNIGIDANYLNNNKLGVNYLNLPSTNLFTEIFYIT